ncbi:MAG: TPM domain-containing protein [Spirochaetales bacterium]|nr:TPM domain-containing protein [Leptospiraceae bacterium]MCP5483563.1 TPM domain-containing protein [Spirochaetales bacterium]MCP5486417.1 TPM domain-containing protein [Spirochaetales bacterium]
MRHRPWIAAPILTLLCLAGSGGLFAERPVPAADYVVDLAGLLGEDKQQVQQHLIAFEQSTGAQMVVLIVPDTDGEPIESFALRVAETWQPGSGDQDNGLLLVVSAGDRRMRLEVGYGLEGVIPDATARRIIADVIGPHFREGRFAAGILEAVDEIEGRLLAEAETEAFDTGRDQTGYESPGYGFFDRFYFDFTFCSLIYAEPSYLRFTRLFLFALIFGVAFSVRKMYDRKKGTLVAAAGFVFQELALGTSLEFVNVVWLVLGSLLAAGAFFFLSAPGRWSSLSTRSASGHSKRPFRSSSGGPKSRPSFSFRSRSSSRSSSRSGSSSSSSRSRSSSASSSSRSRSSSSSSRSSFRGGGGKFGGGGASGSW